ncbi:hypothetical protein [Streptomyces sp. ME19-01-6]|uniref:hypothetical protein n=1 Tax=Streptomyces sp. ME19-01-6 TaxID=3028686 RepID=UPI0029B07378|nr:hypothetical protein [Streptomyces sp. ME19-01-6]MDX3232875.1 hypothetical protein [Streptomyces sp. ME19-01-6]
MAHSKAQLAEVAARRAKLIKLRRACIPFDDPRILALGYSGPGDARKDLVRALQQNRDEEAAEVSVYRQQENERLDALFEAHWPDAIAGDQKAAELVLKFIDRRAKLNGLDMPVKTEVSGPDGGAIPLAGTLDELNSLIATAGQLGPASDFATPAEAEDDDSDG